MKDPFQIFTTPESLDEAVDSLQHPNYNALGNTVGSLKLDLTPTHHETNFVREEPE